MKLLTQNEVYAKKQGERKNELDQGLKIAQKVDVVREELVKDELALRKFRDETLRLVQDEIRLLLVKKEDLQREVDILERQNSNLKKPFDYEWELVKMKRLSDLDSKIAELETRESELYKAERDFGFRDKDLKDAELRIVDENKRAETMLKEANEHKDEADRLISEAKIREAQIQSEIDARTNEFRRKEESWNAQARELDIREEALRRSVKELVRREQFVNDKYTTLARTEKYLAVKQNKK